MILRLTIEAIFSKARMRDLHVFLNKDYHSLLTKPRRPSYL